MATRGVRIGVFSIVAAAFASAAYPLPSAAQNASQAERPASATRAVTLLVFPFENNSRQAKLDWLSEGLAELTIERLSGQALYVYTREERLAALDRLGLPASTHFSRATMLKIAEELDAEYVVLGRYTLDGKTLALSARVLRIQPADLSAPIEEAGPLDDLMDMHARLAWRLLSATGPHAMAGSRSPKDLAAKLLRVRLDALEFYIRGLLSSDDEQRLRDLREAARLEPAWDAPAFALGEVYFARRDCASALPWLSRVPPANRHGAEAGFEAGVCHLLRNDPARAESAFAALLERRRDLPEVLNNLAIARERLGKFRDASADFERATRLDPEEDVYWFNLGLFNLRTNEPAAAVRAFREVLRRQPDDTEARALLIAALEQSGHSSEAAAERGQAGPAGGRPAALPSTSPEALARFDRIKVELDPAALHPATDIAGQTTADAGAKPGEALAHRRQHRDLHMARGQQFLAAGKLYDAQREFSEAIVLVPLNSPAAHEGLAEVFRRQGRHDDAVRELRAALASRDDPATRTALARVLLEQNRATEAREELRAALKLDPGYAEARKLLEQLEARKGSGEP